MTLNFDFAANASVEDVSKLPAEVQGYYEKGADGKFTYAAAHRPLIESYIGMSKTAGVARADLTKANKESAERRVWNDALTSYATEIGLDVKDKDVAEVLKGHVQSLVEANKAGKNIQVDLAKVKKEFDDRVAIITTAKDGELTKMRGTLEKHLIDNAAMAELTAAGASSVTLLMPHIKAKTKVVADGENYVVRVIDDSGNARINGAGAYFTVADLVKEMKASNDFAVAFKSEAKGGTGKQPATPNAGKTIAKQQVGDKSSVDKIAAGLSARR